MGKAKGKWKCQDDEKEGRNTDFTLKLLTQTDFLSMPTGGEVDLRYERKLPLHITGSKNTSNLVKFMITTNASKFMYNSIKLIPLKPQNNNFKLAILNVVIALDL